MIDIGDTSRRPRRVLRTGAMRGAAVAVALLGAACSTVRAPYSQIDHARARIPDMPGVRVWADDPDQPMLRLNTTAPLTMLTLSGGGAEGAYGAGFLSGWTDSGRRPRFTIVTGTSVGALMAPFAFLGPDYDPALKQIYVEGQMENLLRVDGINGLIGSSVFKAEPLKRLIDHYADQALIDAVAAERRKGRFLFVVTTNVDAQRAVVWDLTAVAASPSPNRYTLFRSILMASCAMPGIFPPSLIEVEADGRRFAEMHVDGSVTSNVLAVPEALLLSVLPKVGPTPPRLYVIVNGKLEPDFDVVADHTLSIVARSFWTTVKANTRNTLIATYEFTRRNGWEFRATAIERDHPIATASFNFEPAYMRGLYDYGYERGRSGRGWQAALPRASITARN